MKADGKCRALARFAEDGNLSIVRLNDFFDDGQAEPDPARLPRPRAIGSVKPFKDMGHMILADPFAGIADVDDRMVPVRPQAYGNHAPRPRMTQGIIEKIDKDTLQLFFVGRDGKSCLSV